MLEQNNPYLAVRQAFNAPWPGPRGEKIKLQNDNIQLEIYPEDGCRIINLQAYNYPILRAWQDGRFAFQYGCFPMIPWVGRIKNAILNYQEKSYALPANKPPHAMHGMACFSPWQCISTTQTRAEFKFILDEPWPWKGSVNYIVEIKDDELVLSLQINTDQHEFPASAGWHPWFNKILSANEPEMEIHFSPKWQRKTGIDEIPEQTKITPQAGPWDDCFGFEHPLKTTLLWQNQLQIEMSSSGNHLVIFDKQPDASCVNPMTEAPNDINHHPQIVKQSNPLIITTNWKFNAL